MIVNPLAVFPWKLIWLGTIRQTGAVAPVLVEQVNTLGAPLVSGYTSPGIYTLTCAANPFLANKLVVLQGGPTNGLMNISRTSNSTLTVNTFSDFVNTNADGVIGGFNVGLAIYIIS